MVAKTRVNENNYIFNLKFNQKQITLNLYCDMVTETGIIQTAFSKITILNQNNVATTINFKERLKNFTINKRMSFVSLRARANLLAVMRSDLINPNLKFNMEKFQNGININLIIVNGKITVISIKCSNAYCNNRGTCKKLGRLLECVCNSGYVGNKCEMTSGNFNYYQPYIDQLWYSMVSAKHAHSNQVIKNWGSDLAVPKENLITQKFKSDFSFGYTSNQMNTFLKYSDCIISVAPHTNHMTNLMDYIDTVNNSINYRFHIILTAKVSIVKYKKRSLNS